MSKSAPGAPEANVAQIVARLVMLQAKRAGAALTVAVVDADIAGELASLAHALAIAPPACATPALAESCMSATPPPRVSVPAGGAERETTVDRFWRAWKGSALKLPYCSCAIAQAHRAYAAYARQLKERPLASSAFSRALKRAAAAGGDELKETVATAVFDGAVRRRSMRMLLVAPVPETVSNIGAWAAQCVRQFERPLAKYLARAAPPPPVSVRSASKATSVRRKTR